MVKDLILDEKFWDMNKLKELYDQETIKKIIAIPISTTIQPDTLIWSISVLRLYNIIYAYKNLCSTNFIQNITSRGTNWKELWNLKLPRKITMFDWKMGNNAPPLGMKGFKVPGIFTFECSSKEDKEHLFS